MIPSQAESWLRSLRVFQDDDALPRSALSADGKHRLHGFTVYRTDYSEGTDELWPHLLADMRSHCENALSYYGSRTPGEPRKQDDAVDLLTSLFTIDARSDKDMLDACSVEQLRDIYKDCVGGIPLNPTRNLDGFFYVDAEVFQSMAQRVPYVKMGDPHYDPEEHEIENHPRFPQGQSHWGWFRVEVSDVLDAFESLNCLTFDEMAPPMLRNPEFLTLYGEFAKVPNTNNLEI